LRFTEDIDIQLSHCAAEWDQTDPQEKETLFSSNCINLASKSELVGQNKLIYKINGQYHKEPDAWREILTKTVIGASDLCPVSPLSQNRNRIDSTYFQTAMDSDKTIRSFRPSTTNLKRLELKEGENELTYEYYIAEGVLQKICIKIYLFNSTDKIVVSDIDGTITK
jgi:phosphatidate phosphatase PAH1